MKRLLIANRGEIAVRIARTARRLGIETVAVCSDPDADSLAARSADLAVRLPGQTSAETYLRAEAILEAARRTGADAIHPGYGFLSENPVFARAVAGAGLTWVGPTPEQIEAMALKVESKHLAAKAGVPLVPGAELDTDELDTDEPGAIEAAGRDVGFPLLVKASAGGGGKGMRQVAEPAELLDAVAAARREAASAFGDPTVFLERYLTGARHVEVQVFGDTHGNVVHLYERECSIQRRHQKVVEEAPSPGVDDDLREQMFAAATALAREIGYVGAGTVEFMVAGREFFFLEMNTRLQVEHPVTEETTGLDLVEWQLRVARGESLPLAQEAITRSGHAIEVRLYAEDPANGYLPNTGRLDLVDWRDGARVDTGVVTGSEISSLYDPMIAKIIVRADDRDAAADRLAAYLDALPLVGLTTNRQSLAAILREDDFRAGATTTDYLDTHPQVLAPALPPDVQRRAVLAAVLESRPGGGLVAPGWRNVRAVPEFARVGLPGPRIVRWRRAGDELAVEIVDGDPFTGESVDAFTARATPGRLEIDGIWAPHDVRVVGDDAVVQVRGHSVVVRLLPRFEDTALGSGAAGPSTPVPGTVTLVEVEPGDAVTAGQTLVILEAMKMEHRITADTDGIVAQVLVKPGMSVDAHTVVVVLEEAE